MSKRLQFVLIGSLMTAFGATQACAPRPRSSGEASVDDETAFDGSTEAALTQSVVTLLRAAAKETRFVVIEPLSIDATDPKGGAVHISLDRVWHVCATRPDDCEREARALVHAAAQLATSKREAPARADQVVAVVRPRAYLDTLPTEARARAITEPFAGDLVVVYMVDLPETARTLGSEELAALGVSRAQLPALARGNLAKRLGPVEGAVPSEAKGAVTLLATGEYYESSRMLQLDEWGAFAARVGAPIVVAVPSNDAMIVAIGVGTDVIDKLRELVRKAHGAADRPISAQLYRWSESGWIIME